MNKPIAKKGLPAFKKSADISARDVVKVSSLQQGSTLPVVLSPAIDGLDLIGWAGNNRPLIQDLLLKHGGILFRNFDVFEIADFERFIGTSSGEMLEYRERSSPRSQVSDKIYTSTDYPASQSIFLHNENSYQSSWPLKIFFFCVTPPAVGGETPIADVRKVFNRIDPAIRERFIQRRVMYVRNFGAGLGLPWQTVFQTSDKAAVEEYCRRAGIGVEWKEDNGLRTRQVRQAVARHPHTGEFVWFNHATFFHVSTLDSSISAALLAQFDEQDLPSMSYYGDGAPFEAEVLAALREAYRQETVSFPWQRGDILMLDNMLAAHGRAPYEGPRKIVVGMAEPFSSR